MFRYILLLFILITFTINAQSHIVLVDSTFHSLYIDETTPLPFSPVLSMDFGLPDSANVIVQLHKILLNQSSPDTMLTIPIMTLVDTALSSGKYRVYWNKNDKGKIIFNNDDKFIYWLYIYRKIKTFYGTGYIKIEAKSKITSLNY
jgi:hypothetical protein